MNIEIYNLGDFQITTAGVQPGTVIDGLDELSILTLDARFQYTSGGSTVVAVVQTSLNQGDTWIDIARFDFAITGLEKIYNLTNKTPRTSPYTAVSLVSETSVDGVLGDRLRAIVTSTGTYAGSTVLSIRASVRAA